MNILTGLISKDGMLWLSIILFIIGLGLIIKGGDMFVDAASWFAEVTGIPKLIVGATVVSFATTLPELLVSVFATIDGSIGMATGNAIGSVTANLGLILSISIIFLPSACKREDILLKTILMIAPLVVMFMFGLFTGDGLLGDGVVNIPCAIILLLIFAFFMFDNVKNANKQIKLEAKLNEEKQERIKPQKKEIIKNIIFFVLGAAFIIFGADFMVETATQIANDLNVPEAVIGLTIVAIGTSLPELITTITAIVKKESSLSVGNIIGANIFDLTLILSICSFVGGGNLSLFQQNILLDIPVCIIIGLVALVPVLITQKFKRYQGIVMLGIYIAYTIILVVGVGCIGIVPAPN